MGRSRADELPLLGGGDDVAADGGDSTARRDIERSPLPEGDLRRPLHISSMWSWVQRRRTEPSPLHFLNCVRPMRMDAAARLSPTVSRATGTDVPGVTAARNAVS